MYTLFTEAAAALVINLRNISLILLFKFMLHVLCFVHLWTMLGEKCSHINNTVSAELFKVVRAMHQTEMRQYNP